MRTQAHENYNYANQNNSVVKDYLFPEIRATQDRIDPKDLQAQISLEKLSGRENVMNNRLYSILKDRYYNKKEIFQVENVPLEQKTG